MSLVHCPTNQMIADIVTKNLPGPSFNSIKSIFLNNNLVGVKSYQILLNNLDNDDEVYWDTVAENLELLNI